jgi:hypothetical protein
VGDLLPSSSESELSSSDSSTKSIGFNCIIFPTRYASHISHKKYILGNLQLQPYRFESNL